MKFRMCAAILPALISFAVQAQTPSNVAYAITSAQMGQQHWTEVKQIDLATGAVTGNIFESGKDGYDVFDGRSLKQVVLDKNDSTSDAKRPFSGQSAACAYDQKSNRLYFAALFINELRYIDLGAKTPSVYIFQNESFSSARDLGVEANQMTRMVIGSDGNGYALNNDASHLIRFTTGKIPTVTDLGRLVDAPQNDTVFIADANTSWGGDMVSDASGNLYLITAHNHIFKIDLQTQTATYLKQVKGVPDGYTTNGAVVDAGGQVILSSANSVGGLYKVDPATWEAKLIPSAAQVYNSSDMANENLLFRTPLEAVKEEAPEKISIYPNPVKGNAFKVTFKNKKSGDYDVQMMDIAGRVISDKTVNVYNSGQVADVKLNASMTRGVYLVKVMSHESTEIFSKKIIVE